MRSCKEITRLASDALEQDLPLMTRMGMRLHLMMCTYCRRYVVQLGFIREALGRYDEQLEAEAEGGEAMPDDLRSRLDALVKDAEFGGK